MLDQETDTFTSNQKIHLACFCLNLTSTIKGSVQRQIHHYLLFFLKAMQPRKIIPPQYEKVFLLTYSAI